MRGGAGARVVLFGCRTPEASSPLSHHRTAAAVASVKTRWHGQARPLAKVDPTSLRPEPRLPSLQVIVLVRRPNSLQTSAPRVPARSGWSQTARARVCARTRTHAHVTSGNCSGGSHLLVSVSAPPALLYPKVPRGTRHTHTYAPRQHPFTHYVFTSTHTTVRSLLQDPHRG